MDYSLFRQASLKKVLTPDDSDITTYVQNITLKVWVIIITIFLLLIIFFIGIFTFKIPNTIQSVGIYKNNKLICYLPPEACNSLTKGINVEIDNSYKGKISNISTIPFSKEEIEKELEYDYYKYNLNLSEWNNTITISITSNTNLAADDKLHYINITNGYIDFKKFFTTN